MGIFEGSLAPGSALLMGQYYRRSEFGIRFALFFNCALIGSAFSAFLAYAIEYMNGVAGYAGWRWIFILEGLFSIAFSIVAWFVIPGFPADATFLSDTEKKYLLQRLDAERGHEKITFGSIKWKNCLFDWKIWLATLIYFCGDLSSSSNVSFSPTILTQLGWSHSQAQIHQIPIYLVAVFFSLTSAFLIGRPRVRYRFPFIFVGACFSLIGWAIQLSQVNPPSVRYFGLFAIASGASIIMPMSVVWLNNNIVGRPEKAVAAALQMGFGNSANFVSSNIFITNQAPKYPVAFKTGLCFSVVGLFAGILFPYLLWRKNSQADEREARGERNSEELENAEGIRFRYAL
jgi:sugar phosphate permease